MSDTGRKGNSGEKMGKFRHEVVVGEMILNGDAVGKKTDDDEGMADVEGIGEKTDGEGW